MNYWLIKSEPSTYSWEQLIKDKQTFWSGVRNYAARNYNTAKLKFIFSYLRECDLRSKGIDNVSTEDGELLKEMVFKILH